MSATGATTQVKGVRTVAIPVADQDRAIEFYCGALGLEKRLDAAFGPGRRWVEVGPGGDATTLALVAAEPGRPAGIDTGIRLVVEDAAAAHSDLRGAGVDVDAEIIPVPIPMFAFRDPDGNRLVLVEQRAGA